MDYARRVWVITVYKPANKIPLTQNDDDFMMGLELDKTNGKKRTRNHS